MAYYDVTNSYLHHWEWGCLDESLRVVPWKLYCYQIMVQDTHSAKAKPKAASVFLLSQKKLSPDKAIILDQATSTLSWRRCIF